jgi:hypothetical protein
LVKLFLQLKRGLLLNRLEIDDDFINHVMFTLHMKMLDQSIFDKFKWKHLVAHRDFSHLVGGVDEGAKLSLGTELSFLNVLLAEVSLVLEWVIQSLKCRVAEDALLPAAQTRFLVVMLALLRHVKELVGWSPIVKRFMSIYTMVPVVVLAEVLTVLRLVTVEIEERWIDGF